MWKARDLDEISFIRGENLDETLDLFFEKKKKRKKEIMAIMIYIASLMGKYTIVYIFS